MVHYNCDIIDNPEGGLYLYPITDNTGRQGQILHDISSTGKVRPWAAHKADAQLLSYALELSDPTAAQRVRHCADTLWFRRHEDGTLRLDSAQFCRVRLCPVCQWRRSLKMYGQLHQVVKYLAQQRHAAGAEPYAWVLLTLTVQNCATSELSNTLDTIAAGWDRLGKTKAFKRAVRGTMRAVEITYNRETNTYHPHMHVLCCVLPSYFTSRDYISQSQWSDMWQAAARLDYHPIVDVRRATGTAGSLAEVAKYACKPSDYLDPSDIDAMAVIVGTLHRVCARRRFAAWTGVLRQAHHALHLDDIDGGDLVKVGPLDGESAAGAAVWSWDWYAGPRLYIGGVHYE